MVLEAPTHQVYPVRQKRRGRRISFIAGIIPAIEGECQGFLAVYPTPGLQPKPLSLPNHPSPQTPEVSLPALYIDFIS